MVKTLLVWSLVMLSAFSNAQLAGNYTIGGVNPDFPTIDSAILALTVVGVNDTTVFYIRPGTYSGTHRFTKSHNYPVTFRGSSGNAKDVVFACDLITCNSFTLKHVTLLPIVNTTFYAPRKGMEVRGWRLWIDSCIVQGPSNLTNYNNGIWVRALNAVVDVSVRLTNLKIKNLDNGVVFSGVDYFGSDRYWGLYELSNSEIDSCITAIYSEADVEDSMAIAGNTITNCTYGIHLQGNDVGRTYVQSNKIIDTKNYNIFLDNIRPSTYRVSIFNNFLIGGLSMYGIANAKKYFRKISLEVRDCEKIDIYNNSFNGGIRFYESDDVHIYNNNLCTSKSTPVMLSGINAIYANNNNYYSDSSNYLMSSNNSLSTGLPYFNADTAFSFKPYYFSQTDLHSYSPQLQHRALASKAPSHDIDGEPRNSLPDIGADEYQASDLFPFAWFNPICENDTLGRYFENISVRPDSSYWDFGDGTYSSLHSPIHQYAGYGSYVCSLTVSNKHGQSTYIDTIVLTPRPLEVIQNNAAILSISSGYSEYQWYFDGNPIKAAINRSYKANTPGVYKVRYRDEDHCYRYSSLAMWVGIQHSFNSQGIVLYPNPTDNLIRIKNLNNDHSYLYEILDYQGRMILKGNYGEPLSVKNLPSGMYMLRLVSDYEVLKGRFLKE